MVESKPLNLLDLSFVFMETRQTPMHVAGLQTFLPPPDAPRDFPRQVYEYLRSFPVTAAPFNYVLRGLASGRLLPTFEVAENVSLDYHLRHSALPYPGGERELGMLVSRLHSNPMDLDRPLWEIHLIEGLHGGRFALYAKLHHSLADGISGIGLLNYSDRPDDSRTPPVWAAEKQRDPRRFETPPGAHGAVAHLSAALRNQARVLPELMRGLLGSAQAAIGLKPDPEFASLAEAPRTMFNVDVTPQRRVATQSTTLARMRAIGEAAGGSVNDVLLAACSAALRRYLQEADALPARSLIASVPVALPRDTTQPGGGGNAISFANVKLGTDIDDVRARFEAIRRSSIAGREYLKQMSPTALMTYTVLISSPQMLTRVPAIGARVPPLYNIIISNVPGPRSKLYFLGAEMEAYYPISALAHGQALNITVLSYAGSLFFGFTGCADRVPHLQRLAVYTGEALDELEQAYAQAEPAPPAVPAKRKTRKTKSTGPKRKSTSRARPATADGGKRAPAKRAKRARTHVASEASVDGASPEAST
ncbi:MAG TPA: wax ester/triacylglycerol synthase family O-acyltransferase [Steroidobacteraceae bacterium]|nr:wax ester/triacylglycerol synthase family O-acyltransferase [Steroidobacteraceae bacterium]